MHLYELVKQQQLKKRKKQSRPSAAGPLWSSVSGWDTDYIDISLNADTIIK